MAKHVVRDNGIATPDFIVIDTLSQLEDVRLPYPLFRRRSRRVPARDHARFPRLRRSLAPVCSELLSTIVSRCWWKPTFRAGVHRGHNG